MVSCSLGSPAQRTGGSAVRINGPTRLLMTSTCIGTPAPGTVAGVAGTFRR